MTIFFGTLWSSINQIEALYIFDWEHGIAVNAMLGNQATSRGEREVSWVFSSSSGNLGYILELWWGWPFESRVSPAKSGLLSSYDGHLRNLN